MQISKRQIQRIIRESLKNQNSPLHEDVSDHNATKNFEMALAAYIESLEQQGTKKPADVARKVRAAVEQKLNQSFN